MNNYWNIISFKWMPLAQQCTFTLKINTYHELPSAWEIKIIHLKYVIFSNLFYFHPTQYGRQNFFFWKIQCFVKTKICQWFLLLISIFFPSSPNSEKCIKTYQKKMVSSSLTVSMTYSLPHHQLNAFSCLIY